MNTRIVLSLAAGLLSLAALVQPVLAQSSAPASSPTTERGPAAVDRGPFTPQANQAFQGGGVILQGAPGAPAPAPQALPEAPVGTPAPAVRR